MKTVRKIIGILLVIFVLFSCNAMAENELENDPSAAVESGAEVEIDIGEGMDEIVGNLETILDPENNELEEKVTETLDKYSDNWFVKLFKQIIDAISSFLNAVLDLASEAARIGVD